MPVVRSDKGKLAIREKPGLGGFVYAGGGIAL